MESPIWQMDFRTYVERITIINNTARDFPYIPRVGESVELIHRTWRVVDVQYNHYKRMIKIYCDEVKER